MLEKYYTPDQLEELRQRKGAVGDERIQQVQQEWPELIVQVQAEMKNGTDPASDEVQLLAKRWLGLINEFTGGNPKIAQSLNQMYQQEPTLQQQANFDPRLMEYVSKMLAASK